MSVRTNYAIFVTSSLVITGITSIPFDLRDHGFVGAFVAWWADFAFNLTGIGPCAIRTG
jgi:hypothetical protein